MIEKNKICEYLGAKRDEIVSVIKRLAAIPSVRSEAEPGAPFGRGCRAALEETPRISQNTPSAGYFAGSGHIIYLLPRRKRHNALLCPVVKGSE